MAGHDEIFAMSRFLSLEFAAPIAGSLGAVTLTTAILLILDARLDAEHLVIGYLVPITLIAIQYGSTVALLTSAVSSVAAAYFLFPPKFSIFIASPLHVAELGFFMLLAVIASKITALLMHDATVRKPRSGEIRKG
jgi:K+-sensing histidine kinase KdpD